MRFSARAILLVFALAACEGGDGSARPAAATAQASEAAPPIVRRGFLGAFFRPVGTTPFGVFSVYSKRTAPEPYPNPSTKLFGKNGNSMPSRARRVACHGLRRRSKNSRISSTSACAARVPRPRPNYDNRSHAFGPGTYAFCRSGFRAMRARTPSHRAEAAGFSQFVDCSSCPCLRAAKYGNDRPLCPEIL